jgi:DNA-binding CsgD family transcriptional regulator
MGVRVRTGSPVRSLTSEPWSWPLAGREEELALCRRWLASDSEGGIVLAGAAGVGKTRLMREVLAAAHSSGRPTARATATEAARSIPFGALSHLLPQDSTRSPTTLDLLRHAHAAFGAGTDRGQLVLGVDDAHLLDPVSAMLVLQLVSGQRAFVIATVRTGETAPDVVTTLWKDESCAFLELQPLSRSETATALALALGGDVDGPTEQVLWQVSQGVPLFLRELVLDGLDRGALVERDGLWHLSGGSGVGRRLRDLVLARIGELDDDERSVVETVALGEPVPTAWLGEADAVDRLVRRSVLEARRDGRRVELWFTHPLQGEVVRAGIAPTRAILVTQRLAAALETNGSRRRGDLLRLATWLLECGGEVSADVLLSAARGAQLAFAPVLAERFARAAELAGGGFEARLMLATTAAEQGRFAEAEEALRKLESTARSDADRATVAASRAQLLAGRLGRGDEAAAVIAAARARVRDPTSSARLVLSDGWVQYRLGRPEDAGEAVADIVDDVAVDEVVRLQAMISRANMLAHAGRCVEAVDLGRRSMSMVERVAAAPELRTDAAQAHAWALFCAGGLRAAECALAELYATALDQGDLDRLGRLALSSAVVALHRGRLAEVVRWMRESAGIMREVDSQGMLPWAFAFIAQAAGQLGKAEEAAAAVASTATEAATAARGWIYSASIEHGRGWASAAEGALDDARASFLTAAEMLDSTGNRVAACLDYHDLARVGGAAVAAPRLERLATEMDGEWARACADHAVASASGDGSGLRDSADLFERIGALLFAAEALLEASTAFAVEGRMSSARSCEGRAHRLLEHSAGARTPVILAAGPTAGLTRRESEVAALAARGLSNKEIASRLVVSARTVENQLHSVYGKLGIAGRGELASLFEIDSGGDSSRFE